jgi:hypothetical protein
MGLNHSSCTGFGTHVGGVLAPIGRASFELVPAFSVNKGFASRAVWTGFALERSRAIAAGGKIVDRLF